VKAPKFYRITPILKSYHWLKFDERIEYKLLYVTYKVFRTTQPNLRSLYLRDTSD